MHNRINKVNPESLSSQERVVAAAKFLRETSGDIRAKIAFLLEEGLAVPELIAAIKLAANVQVVATIIEARERPKQNWRMN